MGGIIPATPPFYQHTRGTEYWPEVNNSCTNKGTLLPYPVGDSAAGILNGNIYYCGSYGISHDYNCTMSPVTGGEWVGAPNMIKARAQFSIVSINNSLIAIGGNGEEGIQDTIEIFDGESWSLAPYKLNEPRYAHCSVKISPVDILVIGNFKGSTMEKINTVKGTVSFFGNAPTQKYDFGCAFDETLNAVYVSGGGNGQDGNNNIVQVLDLDTKSWTRLADLNTPRVYHDMEFINGKLTVLGGYNSKIKGKILSTVEQYDPILDAWEVVGKIITAREEFAMVPLTCE